MAMLMMASCSGSPGDHVSRGALQVWAPAPAARFVSIVGRSSRWGGCAVSCLCYRLAAPNVNFSDTLLVDWPPSRQHEREGAQRKEYSHSTSSTHVRSFAGGCKGAATSAALIVPARSATTASRRQAS